MKKKPRAQEPFSIVGIGASAGGLEALQELFDALPADTGMAFVVVMHQLAGSKSLLRELLAVHTPMPVLEVSKRLTARPNHVYVSVPSTRLGIAQGKLESVAIEDGVGMPIDAFFRSLAHDRKELAIAIVLSGTGTDGTLGVQEIKNASGIVMAQEPRSVKFSGMPESAIATRLVDFVLRPAQMPKELVAYARTPFHGLDAHDSTEAPAEGSAAVQRVLTLLRGRTGNDFSHYKTNSIRRRIERRMHVVHASSLEEYARLVQSQPRESELLFRELLIGVTSFFRDPLAFESVRERLGEVLPTKARDHAFRVWVAGCSTGEEAYSLGIVLLEQIERMKLKLDVQIFATDLNPAAVEHARRALYPQSIVGEVGPERIERYFTVEDRGYRVRKTLRDKVVFAVQNIITDPPFTRLDLLACRNVLIYFDAEVQQRLIRAFHYALSPSGILWLGPSETIGSAHDLFEVQSKKWKVFDRKEAPRGRLFAASQGQSGQSRALEPMETPATQRALTGAFATRSIEQALLAELLPACVVVGPRGEMLHVHGRTGTYLEPSEGPQGTPNVFNMAREGLQVELSSVLREAATQPGWSVREGVRIESHGAPVYVTLRARKVAVFAGFRDVTLLAFETLPSPPGTKEGVAKAASGKGATHLAHLEAELRAVRESHHRTTQDLEATNDELKSANEELQSTNEELQSANEEMETSKEEMQSLNEELNTLNAELQSKLESLARVNDDMRNLLNATDIATLFLDGNLNIKRYTDQAQRLIRLIPSDVGRPIGDLVSTLRYPGLVRDAEKVLKTLVYKELEIQSESGKWYLTRMLPYRTADNVIDGLVITFVDITSGKQLRELEQGLVDALASSATCVYGQGEDLRFKWVFGSLYGHDKAAVLGKTDAALLPPEEALKVVTLKRRALAARAPQRGQVTLCIAGKTKTYDLHMHVARPQGGEAELICVSTELDALRGLPREVSEPVQDSLEPKKPPARPGAKTSNQKKPRAARARGKKK